MTNNEFYVVATLIIIGVLLTMLVNKIHYADNLEDKLFNLRLDTEYARSKHKFTTNNDTEGVVFIPLTTDRYFDLLAKEASLAKIEGEFDES